jgi:hypothetical protein
MLPEEVASGAETRNLGFGTLQVQKLCLCPWVHLHHLDSSQGWVSRAAKG